MRKWNKPDEENTKDKSRKGLELGVGSIQITRFEQTNNNKEGICECMYVCMYFLGSTKQNKTKILGTEDFGNFPFNTQKMLLIFKCIPSCQSPTTRYIFV